MVYLSKLVSGKVKSKSVSQTKAGRGGYVEAEVEVRHPFLPSPHSFRLYLVVSGSPVLRIGRHSDRRGRKSENLVFTRHCGNAFLLLPLPLAPWLRSPLTQTLGQGAIPQAVCHTGQGGRPQQVEPLLAVVHHAHPIFEDLRKGLLSMANCVFHKPRIRTVYH